MKSKIVFILLLGFIITSCDKNNKMIIFKGVVTEYGTDKPLSNTLVMINRNDGFTYNSPDHFYTSIVDTTWTDNNGYYKFSFYQNDKEYYKVSAYRPNYVTKVANPNVIANVIEMSEVNYSSIILGKAGILRLELRNIVNDSDTISLIVRTYDHPTYPPDYFRQVYRLGPLTNDTINIGKFLYIDNLKINIGWTIRNNPIENSYDTIIELYPMDTSYLTIHY